MKINLLYFIILIQFCSCQEIDRQQIKAEPTNFSLDSWLDKICERKSFSDKKRIDYDIDTSAIELIEEYYQTDSLFQEFEDTVRNHFKDFYHPYLQGIKYDMDGDNIDEIICFIATVHSSPTLMVFAKGKSNEFKKIYQINLWLHNEYPTLRKLNNPQNSLRLIRTGEFHYRGSGHWLYAFKYLKKINEEVKLVLETPYRANDNMNFDLLNTSAYLIHDSLINDNQIKLNYEYNSTGGFELCKQLNLDFDFKDPIDIIDNQNMTVVINWNQKEEIFKSSESSKINALLNIENDTLQWKEFSEKINKSLSPKVLNFVTKSVN